MRNINILVPTHLKAQSVLKQTVSHVDTSLLKSDESNVLGADGTWMTLHQHGRLPYCGNFAHRRICKRRLKSSHLMT